MKGRNGPEYVLMTAGTILNSAGNLLHGIIRALSVKERAQE